MNPIARFVVERGRFAWTVAIAASILAGTAAMETARSIRENERHQQLSTDAQRRSIELMSQTLNGNLMGSVAMLGLVDANIKREAIGKLPPNVKDVFDTLESVGRSYDAEGVFLVLENGLVGSSWDNSGKPSTGLNVKFRPYYQMAMQGMGSVYAAVSLARGDRALYFAAPIFGENTSGTVAVGAIVARTGLMKVDDLLRDKADIALLLSPQGVVFASSRKEWIGYLAGKPTAERLRAIRELKQFGNLFEKADPLLLPMPVETGIIKLDDKRYSLATANVEWNDPFGDWKLVLLEDLGRTMPVAERGWIGLSVSLLCLLVGTLLLKMLQSSYRQALAGAQLEQYARDQESSAARKSQLAAAAIRLQQARNLPDLMVAFFTETHNLFGALQGVAYVTGDDDAGTTGVLRLAGSYACAEAPPATLTVGEGLLGQCATEQRPQMMTCAPDGFAMIRSGLGDSRPSAVLITPIVLHGKLLAVAEIALLKPLDTAGENQLDDLLSLLAMNIEVVSRGAHVEQVLNATQAAEQAAAEKLAFQQVLVDTIPYPVFVKDANARFLSFNKAYEETFKVSRSDLIGKRVLDLMYLPEADRLAYQAEDEATIASAGTIKRDMEIPFADGKDHDTMYFVSGFRMADGTPGGLVGTFIDVSEIRQAEEHLNRLADAERFNRLAQGRELRILELKREINALAKSAGQAEPYATTLVETSGDHPMTPHPDYRTTVQADIEHLQLGDLVDLEELQTLFTGFCESVGIAAAIIDLEGKVLASSRWQRACTDFHRTNPGSCARCIESDTELALKLQDGQDFTMYKCKNGMTDCASPIIIEGRHLANVFIGQFHLGPPDMEFFRQQARQFGYPETEYLQAVAEAPVADEKRLPVILGFLSGFARMVSNMSLARFRADAAQAMLKEQAELLRRERLAAMSLAEDNVQARMALEQGGKS